MGGESNRATDRAREVILNGGGDGVLKRFVRPPSRASEKGGSWGQLEAWELAAGQGMLNFVNERSRSKMKVRKVTGGSSQQAQEGSRSGDSHAAKTKSTVPLRESQQR